MCWISRQKPEARIAGKDIPVIKILKFNNYTLFSFHYKFNYFKNRKYEINNLEINDYSFISYYTITKGFHSYSNDCKIIPLQSNFFKIIYNNKYVDAYPTPFVKASCIIPKGSEYYLNENGEYVSNSIKIISVKNVLEE